MDLNAPREEAERAKDAVMGLIASAAIRRAATIALEEGNALAELSNGWSRASQVLHMAKELSVRARQRIESELPSLRFWSSPATPHNPATRGFICDVAKVGLSFPDGSLPTTATP